jgi:hypothetical protein
VTRLTVAVDSISSSTFASTTVHCTAVHVYTQITEHAVMLNYTMCYNCAHTLRTHHVQTCLSMLSLLLCVFA